MLKVVAFVFALLVANTGWAQSNAKPSSAGQGVTVKTGTAIVYDKPSFDGSAVGYLSSGENLRVSKKTYGGMQKFYKVRMKNGKFGYISTIDVQTNASKQTAKAKANAAAAKGMSDSERDKLNRERVRRELKKPMVENTWFGLAVGTLSFREKIVGTHGKDQLLTYGLKITGPDILLQGPIMDINLLTHFGAPKYYSDVSLTKPTGLMLFSDALIVIPFGLGFNSSIFAGFGPMLKYTNFKYVSGNEPRSSSEFKFGGSFAAGAAYRLGAFSVRLEGKYYVEALTHTQIQLGLQTLY